MKNYLAIILLSIFFVSCTTQSDSTTKELLIGDAVELDDLNDLFQEVELIFLDSNKDALISRAEKIYIVNDKLFVHDSKNHNINVYDMSGNFLYNTQRLKGRARNEFIVLSDYRVNSSGGNIELFDPMRTQIMVLDDAGRFEENISLSEYSEFNSLFEKIDDDKYIFGGMKQEYTIYDYKLGVTCSQQTLDSGFPPQTFITNDTQEFHHSKDSLFFIPQNDKYIYAVNHSSEHDIFTKMYELTLLDNPLTPKDVEGMTISQVSDFMQNGAFHSFSTFNRRFITDKYIIASYIFNTELHTYLYNRLSGNSVCVDNAFASGDILAPISAVYDYILYSMIEAQHIPILFPFHSFPDEITDRIKGITDNDNMVLVRYTLRGDIL